MSGPTASCPDLPVLTDIAAAWPDEVKDAIAAGAPLRRIGQPNDYVGAAVWLAGDASAYVTGAFVRVDGGACSTGLLNFKTGATYVIVLTCSRRGAKGSRVRKQGRRL